MLDLISQKIGPSEVHTLCIDWKSGGLPILAGVYMAIYNKQPPHPKRHYLHSLLLISLPWLAVIVTLAGIFGFRLFNGGVPGTGQGAPKAGPSAQSPSNL